MLRSISAYGVALLFLNGCSLDWSKSKRMDDSGVDKAPSSDAGGNSMRDAAPSTGEAGTDVTNPDAEAAAPDAGLTSCDLGFRLDDTGACVNIDECSDASICTRGGTCSDATPGYTCSCSDGSQTNNAQFAACIDINECEGSTVCSGTYNGTAFDYPCLNADPYYRCEGQLTDWPLTDPPNRFTAIDDVVSDAKTGLQWQRTAYAKADACSASDPGCNLLAAVCGTDALCNWDQAQSYCSQLVLGTFTDWRLPSIAELTSIRDITVNRPTINAVAFPETPQSEFWSTSPFLGAADSAWALFFGTGNTTYIQRTLSRNVRCVRAGE